MIPSLQNPLPAKMMINNDFLCAMDSLERLGFAPRKPPESQVPKAVERLPNRLARAIFVFSEDAWRGCNRGLEANKKARHEAGLSKGVILSGKAAQEASAPMRWARRETLREAVFL